MLSSASSCLSSRTRSRARSSVLMASGISPRAIWRTSIIATSLFAASAERMSLRRSAMSWARSCAFCAALRECSVLRTLSGFAGADGSAVDGKGECADGRLGETCGGNPSRLCVSFCCLSVALTSFSVRIWIESCQSRSTRQCRSNNDKSRRR